MQRRDALVNIASMAALSLTASTRLLAATHVK
jgi:hypothetical protein